MLYKNAISQAMVDALRNDERVVIIGQNVTTPHGVFGTVSEAARLFPKRVLEMPISETMMTGACVGLAMEGWKPILVQPRADFSLFSFEHLINTAAKFNFLHGEPLPFIMRCVVGRGWGQGPVHSQSWHHLLAQIPGLDVFMPVLPGRYHRWLKSALESGTPTIIFEPRRLYDHDLLGMSDQKYYPLPDITIFALGDMVLEGYEAVKVLEGMGVRPNLHVWEHVVELPSTDHPYLLVDTVVHRPSPGIVSPPFIPQGASVPMERMWYPSARDIVVRVCQLLGKTPPAEVESHASDIAVPTSAF